MSFVATALVTGGTSGLGWYCALFIARRHPDWQVLLASRRDDNGAALTLNTRLRKLDGRRTPNVFFLPLDCSSRRSVRQFAQTYASTAHPVLKTIVFNAGVQVVRGVRYSDDGEELTFATNHTGQALLLFLLQGHLAEDAHVTYISSSTHNPKQGSRMPGPRYISAELCAHPQKYAQWDTSLEGRRRYALSKLANVMWLYALRRRAQKAGKKWTVAAFDPGLMPGTGLARDSSLPLRLIWRYILPNLLFLIRRYIPHTYTPEQSGRILAELATSDGLVSSDDTTAHRGHDGPLPTSIESHDVDKQDDLWRWTVQQVSQSEQEKQRFDSLGD